MKDKDMAVIQEQDNRNEVGVIYYVNPSQHVVSSPFLLGANPFLACFISDDLDSEC